MSSQIYHFKRKVPLEELKRLLSENPKPILARNIRIIIALQEGKSIEELKKMHSLSKPWIETIMERWETDGLEGLRDQRNKNKAEHLLSEEQREELKEILESQEVSVRWGTREVQAWMEEKIQKTLPRSTPHRYLKNMGYTLVRKKPLKSHELPEDWEEEQKSQAQRYKKDSSSQKRYPSDLTDEEWDLIKEYIPNKPFKYELREIVNALFYVLQTGVQWQYLPKDFPPFGIVFSYFQQWNKMGIFEKITHILRRKYRKENGREEEPSGGIIDSQSVKSSEKGG